MTTFSKRNQLQRAIPITINQSAPKELREFIWQALFRYFTSPIDRKNFAFTSVDRMPPISAISAEPETKGLIFSCEWFCIYDLAEALFQTLFSPGRAMTQADAVRALEFMRLLNSCMEQLGIAYTMDSAGHIVHRGDEAFDSAIKNATLVISDEASPTAKAEIHRAIEDLAKRPSADLSGAIQHAMAGLECLANQACSTQGVELGKLVKTRTDIFPPPLNDVLPKLYGYASNNGRHLTEGLQPAFAEAELLVGIAAIVSTYLARKLNL